MTDPALAARLREAREHLGLTPDRAAARAGMAAFTLQLFEGGGYVPSKRTMKRIARAYGRDAAWLREGDRDA